MLIIKYVADVMPSLAGTLSTHTRMSSQNAKIGTLSVNAQQPFARKRLLHRHGTLGKPPKRQLAEESTGEY
jgi:hypothetical protein